MATIRHHATHGLLALLSAACIAPLAAPDAEARSRKVYAKPHASPGYVYGYARSRGSAARHAERARADSVDPAGNFRGYPDWARWALSPKSSGSSIR